jgi:hypothetical protein
LDILVGIYSVLAFNFGFHLLAFVLD